jgi:dienelactone hydrolase
MAPLGTQWACRPWSGVLLAIAWLLVAALAGCSGENVSIHVDHVTSLIDEPLNISVTGLSSNEKVTLRAATVDPWGQTRSSNATFAADSGGSVAVARAAPISGTYSGVDPMGLFWSMQPDGVEFPISGAVAPSSLNESVTLTADVGGKSVARRTIVRRLWDPTVPVHEETVAQVGFFGKYFPPSHVNPARPAVLMFGGSEGGLGGTYTAALLASHGYPVLAVAYFKAPGLPGTLSQIPLEYFAGALSWLRTQPGVDPRHVLTYGVSRGSEAALLLGVYYPELVEGVIALVPSDAALCSLPCFGPAWILSGQPLPYTRQFNNPYPTDDPSAVIPVERIQGPILLSCGGADQVWHSCPYSDAIVARLKSNKYGYPYTLLAYPKGGHGVGVPIPYLAGAPDAPPLQGSEPDANQRAREQSWPRLLSFLDAVAHSN